MRATPMAALLNPPGCPGRVDADALNVVVGGGAVAHDFGDDERHTGFGLFGNRT